MTREQAINYLICRGFTNEQVGDVVRALTYEPARLSVDEVTALAEWTEKLTKECEVAYNKGYADGMKAQEPQKFKWCTDCKEYDQEKHCCHRWSKVIRDTVEEMKQEQEPILDKIRAEIEDMDAPDYGFAGFEAFYMCQSEVLQIIDKYKAKTEET